MMSVFVFVNLQSKYVDEDRRGNVVPDKECGNSSYLDVIPMNKWKLLLRSVQKVCLLAYVMSANGSSQQASLRSERSAQKSSSLKIPGQDMSNLESLLCDGFLWKLPDGEYPLRISSLSTWFPIVKLIWCRRKKVQRRVSSSFPNHFPLTRETASVQEAKVSSHLCVSNG